MAQLAETPWLTPYSNYYTDTGELCGEVWDLCTEELENWLGELRGAREIKFIAHDDLGEGRLRLELLEDDDEPLPPHPDDVTECGLLVDGREVEFWPTTYYAIKELLLKHKVLFVEMICD